ncbi:MAG: SHOCT domain-containing protein [Ktedonobacterales bacterium]
MEPGEHYYGMGFHPNPFGILFGLGFMLLFWGLLFGIPAWFIVRRFGRNRWRAMAAPRYPTAQTVSAPPAPSAMEILRRRYVQGEIDHATFEEMMHNLAASLAREQQIPWPNASASARPAHETRETQDPREASQPEIPTAPEDIN